MVDFTSDTLLVNATGYVYRHYKFPREYRKGKGAYESFILDVKYGLIYNYGKQNGAKNISILKTLSFYVECVS